MALKDTLKSSPRLRSMLLSLITADKGKRPRWWIRNLVNPVIFRRGKRSVIFRYVRLDIMPYNGFEMGSDCTIESFSFINNGMGPVKIGNNVFLGASNVIIGPVNIEDHVMTAQNVVISGLNHGFEHVDIAYRYQPSHTAAITIGEGSWVGANVVITAGVTIGKFSIIAAGSVVTKVVPPYTMVAGNPARPIKTFNQQTAQWQKVSEP